MAKRGIDIIRHMFPRPRNVIDLSLVPRGGIVLDLGPEFIEIDPLCFWYRMSFQSAERTVEQASAALVRPYPAHLLRG